ncbi:hypothetical protein O6H91_04G094000 [Diphasiastrum complanatum]|uniref:Uncharacterized protein n=1 Tax=Diphasiastrum complanatum TaxID=34168 RepID=A0ACC2DZU1_DIPCM|nr:hypothetical protein O6H91_04G094000 [Diphasiastrum complanatum]
MLVVPVHCLEDNYAYLIVDEVTKDAAVVDPVWPEKVLEEAKRRGAVVSKVLTTHRHWDHAGGNNGIRKLVPDIKVYGGTKDSVEGCTDPLKDGDEFPLSENVNIKALHTPCHTKGHISYYVTSSDGETPAVFTGDTLFVAGCGKFFEGSAEDMYYSLLEKLASLPAPTRVFCGHEYTVQNLKFALTVEPHNGAMKSKLAWAEEQRKKNLPTVPSTIAQELDINPFMRVNLQPLKIATGRNSPIEVMAEVRRMKDNFK